MEDSAGEGPKMGKHKGTPARIALEPSQMAFGLQYKFSRPSADWNEMTVAPTAWILADAPDAVCVIVVRSLSDDIDLEMNLMKKLERAAVLR